MPRKAKPKSQPSPYSFRAPADVIAAMKRWKKEGKNITQEIVAAIRDRMEKEP